MDRTSLYRALNPLRREGWIELQEGPEKRSRSAVSTTSGRAVLDGAAPIWEAMQIAIIERFGRSAWLDLVDDLNRLQACIPSEGLEVGD